MNFISENHEKAWHSALEVLKPTQAQLEHGLELHRTLFVMDQFCFLPSGCWNHNLVQQWDKWKEYYIGGRELSKRTACMMFDECCRDPEFSQLFRKAIKATGLKCMVQTVAEGKSREEDIRRMACNVQLLRTFRDVISQAGNIKDIEAINAEGKTAVIWSVNGPPLLCEQDDPQREFSWIDDWRRIGVRLMHLSYNRRNFIADGCAEISNGGLSDMGRELVLRLNKAGIIVDVPHTGQRSSIEAAQVSTKPIMASHTGAKALFDFIRCKDDETLKAIADGGGLIGVYAYPGMIGGNDDLAQMLNHIEYIAHKIGIDHVGIGTDLQYHHNWPSEVYEMRNYPKTEYNSKWWGNYTKFPFKALRGNEAQSGSLAWINWPLYTVGLVTRGFSDEDISKILGRNFLRVFQANSIE